MSIGKLNGAQVETGEGLATAPVDAGRRDMSNGVCRFDSRGRLVEWDNAGLAAFAGALSRSQVVPKAYQNEPNNCFVACHQAAILGISPLVYMQNSAVVHGKPAPEGKLFAAILQTSGKIKGRIRYAYEERGGRPVACTAIVIDKETGEELRVTIDQAMVDGEGWSKNNPKWKNMPAQMYAYRSATFLVRRHYPEVMLGFNSAEEWEDLGDDPDMIEGETVDAAAAPETAIERMRAMGAEPTVDPANEPAPETESGIPADEEAEILAKINRESNELFPA